MLSTFLLMCVDTLWSGWSEVAKEEEVHSAKKYIYHDWVHLHCIFLALFNYY